MKEKSFLFEVQTIYKSGWVGSEIIAADSEEEMWNDYDKHHNASLIKSSMIIDCNIQ